MNKKLIVTSEYNQVLKTINEKGVREQIASKSNNIKAMLKSKYLIYKLQRELFIKNLIHK